MTYSVGGMTLPNEVPLITILVVEADSLPVC
jgi:hypothetical protein